MKRSGEPHESPRGGARTGPEGKGPEGKGPGRETKRSRAEMLSALYEQAADELDRREVLGQ